ncbi:MAG: cupin domain-containing protein [Beijerinckiaceae bacterium]|nr:cupin domain-containing protein [Beijerinckiaceae bacterium]
MDDAAAAKQAYQTFSYKKPDNLRRGKGIVELAKSTLIRGRVQIIGEGGENNLHSHKGMDGFWMVLSGKVKFYGPGDVLIAEFGKHEGILIPAGSEYWFEASGDEPLEILQMAGFDTNVKLERVDAAPVKLEPGSVNVEVITKQV